MSTSSNDKKTLAETVALIYAGKDWHKLSGTERAAVTMLEKSGHLSINKPPNGFVGRAIVK